MSRRSDVPRWGSRGRSARGGGARVAAFAGVTFLAGCPSSAPPPQRPKPWRPPVVLTPRDDLDAPRAVPLEIAPVDPEGEKVLREHASQPAIALEPGQAPPVTLAALEATARGEAKGAELDGAPRVVTLAEGTHASVAVPLVRGDCISVIAHGGLGVMEVDAFLVASSQPGTRSGGDLAVLAQDARTGPLAIIGGQRGCYLASPLSLEGVELWVQVRKGTGPVVVGIYRVPRPG